MTKNKNSVVPKIVIVVLIVAGLTCEYLLLNYSYKKGYAEGTNNQVICQASVSNPTLNKLCK